MQIEISILILGIVIGAAITFLTGIATLRSITVKLDKLGIGLGIEGFDETGSLSSVQTGDISGTTGNIDIAGRDINKNSYMYKTMQAVAHEAAKNALAEFVINDKSDSIKLQRVIRFQSRTRDSKLRSKLKDIESRHDNGWLNDYFAEYLASSAFLHDVEEQKRGLDQQGWRVTVVRPLDNFTDGIFVELIAEKMM